MGLFGGGTTTTTSTIDSGIENFRNRLFGQQQRLPGFNPFGGQRIQGIDPSEQQGFNTLSQIDPRLQQQIGQAGGAIGQGMGILGGLGGDLDLSQFINPNEQQVIGGIRSDFADIQKRSLNAVGGEATAAGAFGGSRQALREAETLRGLAREEGNTIAGVRSQNFQAAVQNALSSRGQQAQIGGQLFGQGLGLAGFGEQLQQRVGQAQLGLGGLQRGLGQAGLDFDFQEFMRQQNQPAQNLALGGQLLGQSPFGTTNTEKTSGGGLGGLIGGIASIGSNFLPGGQALGALSGLFGGGGGGGGAPAPGAQSFGGVSFGQGFLGQR